MYNATAPLFRRVVFKVDRAECIALAARGTEPVMKYAEQYLGDVEFGYQYRRRSSPAPSWSSSVEVCNAVMDVRSRRRGHEIILNLPATVEMHTPNAATRSSGSPGTSATGVRAISLHPHNDRGIGDSGDRAGPDGRRRPGRGPPVRPRRADRQR